LTPLKEFVFSNTPASAGVSFIVTSGIEIALSFLQEAEVSSGENQSDMIKRGQYQQTIQYGSSV
jgi:hypothetical protein